MHGIMNPGVKIRQKIDQSRICVNIDEDKGCKYFSLYSRENLIRMYEKFVKEQDER